MGGVSYKQFCARATRCHHISHGLILAVCDFVRMYLEGIQRNTRLKAKNKTIQLHFGVTDEQMRPKTPLMQTCIQPPNLSSLVSHDEFNKRLIRKVWLCPPSSGPAGNNSPPEPLRYPMKRHPSSNRGKRRS